MDFDNPERVRSYVYRCSNQSILYPLLRRYLCQPLLVIVPTSWSPNLITFFGHGAVLLGFIWIVALGESWLSAAALGAVTSLVPAASIALYIVADTLDGLQARRLGVSGPLGDYLEHGLDAIAGTLIPLGALMAYGADMGLAAALVLGCAMAWWTATAERWTTGELRLPPFSEIETHGLVMATHLVAAVAGPGFWRQAIFGVAAIDGMAVIGIAVSAVIAGIAISKIGPATASLPGLGASLLLFAGWYLGLRLAIPEFAGSPWPALILGLASACHVEELLRRCLLGTKPQPYNWILVLTGGVLAFSLMLPATRNADLQQAAMTLAIAVVGVRLISQFASAIRFISSTLGIRILEVPRSS